MGALCSKSKSPATRVIVFDYEEVVWMHSRNVHVYKRMEKSFGLEEGSLLETLLSEELQEALPETFIGELLSGNYIGKDFDRKFTKVYNAKNGTSVHMIPLYSTRDFDCDAVYEDALLKASNKLRKLGFKTFLLMNTYHIDDTRQGRKLSYVKQFFDQVFESCIEGYCKPDFRLYKKLISKLQCKASEVLLLEDDNHTCKMISTLGIKTLEVTNTMDAIDDLERILGVNLL